MTFGRKVPQSGSQRSHWVSESSTQPRGADVRSDARSARGLALCLLAVFALALLVRVGWVGYRWRTAGDGPALVFADEHDYWTGARSLAAGEGLVDADGRRATRMPLYPWLLSHFADPQDGAWWARIAQAIFAALVAPFIALLAWRLAGLRAAFLAGALVALDPYLVYFTGLLLTEVTFTSLLVLLLVVSWPLALPDGRRRVWRWPMAAALFLGMAYLRPSILGLWPLWALVVAIVGRRASGGFPGLVTSLLILVAGLAPWAWRNYRVLGEPIPLTTRLGISLYDGLGPEADGSSNLGYTRLMEAHRLEETEWNRWFREQALEALREDPWRAARLAVVKARRTWDPWPHAEEAQSPAIRLVSVAWTLPIYVFALVGLIYWRRHAGTWLLLLLPAIYLTLVHMLFVGSIRYRLPAMPFVSLLAAVGVCRALALVWPGWRPAMPPTPPEAGDHQSVLGKGSYWGASHHRGRPIPLWRRRLAMALLLLLAMGYGAYQYFTSDERVRRQAESFLTRFTGGDVRIGHARFGLFSGIVLHDVSIAMPPGFRFDPTAETRADREAFSAVRLQLQHEPFSLLTGKLEVTEILAETPTLVVVKNLEFPGYDYNWQALFPPQPEKPEEGRPQMPLIRIRNAYVRIVEIAGNRRRDEPEIRLSALALPDPHREELYTIPWRKSGEQPERGRLYYNLRTGTYSGKLPMLQVTTVKAAMPKRYTDWLETLEIAGQIRPEQIRYDPRRASRAVIRLEDMKLSVPVASEERPTTQAAKRFLQLSEVEGELVLTPLESNARFTGKLNGADCTVDATVRNYAGPLEEAGFDIKLKVSRVELPDPNDPAGARFIRQIPKVRSFFHDFDPAGLVDVDFRLLKSPGRDMGVILRGTLTALDCAGSYRKFPYRVQRMTGRVRFAEDGVWLENLAGDHGSGFVVINGHVDGTNWYTGFDLHIVGQAVPLDPELFRAVPERFRAMWRQFRPVGLANVDVDLRRERGTEETGPGTWSTKIRARLIETIARFDRFPYPLGHVGGSLVIENDQIVVDGLTGSHGSTSVRIDGRARYDAQRQGRAELRVEASDLALDKDLERALPEASRDALAQFGPEGKADLLGRVYLRPKNGRVAYDVLADLRDASLRYESLPYAVEGIRGKLRITPKAIEVSELDGTHGDTTISARGTIERAETGTTNLVIDCDPLHLDEELYQALPKSIRRRWHTFDPSGDVRLRAHIRRVGRGESAVSSHHLTIDALGANVRYEDFPLPLEDVRGRIHLSDAEVKLLDVTARHGEGRIALSGEVPLVGEERVAKLRLEAKDLAFDEALRKALPKRVSETWDKIRPQGRFDLMLDELTCRVAPNQPSEWAFDGTLSVHDAALRIGFDAEQLEGSLVGRGSARGGGADITVDAEIRLDRGAVNRRVLTNVTGRMRRGPDSDVLWLDDLRGDIYDGQAAGMSRITFGPSQTRYDLYMIVEGMSLGPFLDSTREKGTPPTKAKGTVDGRLYLSGVSGKGPTRRGTGQVHIRQAQMVKLPLVLSMLSAVNLTIPDDNAFHDAQASFYLQGDRLVFEKIELQGRAFSMLGGGSMNIDSQEMDLTFLTGSPHPLPRIPILIDLARGASREIMEIAVTGPLEDPKIEGHSLYSLRTTLDLLFPKSP